MGQTNVFCKPTVVGYDVCCTECGTVLEHNLPDMRTAHGRADDIRQANGHECQA